MRLLLETDKRQNMNKQAIFNDVEQIMTVDYAGLNERKVDAVPFRNEITEQMNEVEFVNLIENYLKSFRDGHVRLVRTASDHESLGFTVRRDGQTLYVIDAESEDVPLSVGEGIVNIDGVAIQTIADQYQSQLDPVINRQDWSWLLRRGKVATLEDGREVSLQRYEKKSRPEHSFKVLSEGVGYMKLTDFLNPADTNKLLLDNETTLDQLDFLIVDTRKNDGGNDLSYFKLLEYFVTQETDLDGLFEEELGFNIHWTARNKKSWLERLSQFKNHFSDETWNAIYSAEMKKWDSEASVRASENEEDSEAFILSPKGKLQHVYVLSDWQAGSAGDNFIFYAKAMDKVTVVGRNTLGIIDYGNVASQPYEGFRVDYPVTRSKLIDQGLATNGVGIEPEVFIPWTHKLIIEDADLAWVKRDIEKRKGSDL